MITIGLLILDVFGVVDIPWFIYILIFLNELGYSDKIDSLKRKLREQAATNEL